MNIILIGFMGSGKSSVAACLGRRLNIKTAEMDDLVLKVSGRSSINEIFEIDGEDTFRRLEERVAGHISLCTDQVTATGGGVVMNPKTMQWLHMAGRCIFLKTSFTQITARLENDRHRPLWKNREDARMLFDRRSPLYQTHADLIVSTDGKSVKQVVEDITVAKGAI